MPKITFYPLGNADSYLISLEEKQILYDFGNKGGEKTCDLPVCVKEDISWPDNKEIDIVAFTHNDDDHVHGAKEFFYLDHAKAYQSDDRVKIGELWVPAAMIVDGDLNNEDARVLRQEARHRLEKGYGIKVFSRPKHLKDWLNSKNLTVDDRRDFIVDAGDTVDSVTLAEDGIEIFSHSPFAEQDGDQTLDRNSHSLVHHATFEVEGHQTKFFLGADTPYDVLGRIVTITKNHGNEDRLQWDIYKTPHHCSYKSLGPEKGVNRTEPTEEIQELLDYGRAHGIIVITCDPVPSVDTDQPPHRQAHKTYKDHSGSLNGDLVITMENPNKDQPKRTVIEIGSRGATLKRVYAAGAAAVITQSSNRVG